MKVLKQLNKTKSFLSGILLATMLMFPAYVFAESDIIHLSASDEADLLIENGYVEDTFEALPDKDSEFIAELIQSSPDDVETITTSVEIDNLAEIEGIMSHTDEELVGMGADPQLVKLAKEKLFGMHETPDATLANEYQLSSIEVKLLDKAIEKGLAVSNTGETDTKASNSDVASSGTIASSKLSVSITKADISTKKYPVSYGIWTSFSWSSPYLVAIFSDKLATSWGGGLNVVSEYGTANYACGDLKKWLNGYSAGSKSMSTSETANKAMTYTFKQSNGIGAVRSGSASQIIRNTKKSGKESNVLVQYGHRVIGVSASLSLRGPGITFSGAWDTSAQKKATIIY
jgi:hypothetical protein